MKNNNEKTSDAKKFHQVAKHIVWLNNGEYIKPTISTGSRVEEIQWADNKQVPSSPWDRCERILAEMW